MPKATAEAPPPSPSAFADEQDEAAEMIVSDVVRLPENVPSLASEIAQKKSTGSGVRKTTTENVPVAGSGLPQLKNVQWERKSDRPGFYAWHAPQGSNAPRNTKNYLGYVGKKLLAEWLAMPPDERRAVVADWINELRAEKGIG